MPRRLHPKKEIEAALRHAESKGWRVEVGRGHAWGKMYCPYNSALCRCGEFCIASIWSTPKNPANHGKQLRRVVDNCTGPNSEAEEWHMKEYDFTLKYRLGRPNEDAGKYLEALAESGCEDAIVGVGQNGRISLNFIREAETALDAITSAISDVQKAIPEAKLVEATPDFVGVTDIADLFGFSRQYMRKLIQTRGASFPEPVHEGKPSLWHLTDILAWFREHESRDIQIEILEVSKINMQLNVYKSCVQASASFHDGFKFEANAPNNVLQGMLRRAIASNHPKEIQRRVVKLGEMG